MEIDRHECIQNFFIKAEIAETAPLIVKKIIFAMCSGADLPTEGLPDHEFFNNPHFQWDKIFTRSASFEMTLMIAETTHGEGANFYLENEDYDYVVSHLEEDRVCITITASRKLPIGHLLLFLDWISPYLDNHEGEFLGFICANDFDDTNGYDLPILLHHPLNVKDLNIVLLDKQPIDKSGLHYYSQKSSYKTTNGF